MSSGGFSNKQAVVNNQGSGPSAFAVSYQISPIILVSGIAQNVSGGMIPIVSLLQSQDYDLGLLSQSNPTDLEDFFANFVVLDGDTLIQNEISHWPLANLVVAANNVVSDPLKVSLLMNCPGQVIDGGISYTGKQAVMTALQNSLTQHIAQGGWFNVATPSFVYSGCLLLSLRNVSRVSGGQVQLQYVWEFEQPLISAAAAQGAMNTQMQKISSQTQTTGDPPSSGATAASVGVPSSNIASSLVPAAQNPAGSNVVPTGAASGAQNGVPSVASVSPIAPGG